MQLISKAINYLSRILLFVCAFYGIYILCSEWLGQNTGFIVALVIFLFAEYKDHEKEFK